MLDLSEQITSFTHMLPELKKTYGSAWVIFTDHQPIESFADFEMAAQYVFDHYTDEPVLIRHTDEVKETVPFIVIEA